MYRGDYLKVYNPNDRAWHEGWAVKAYGFENSPTAGFLLRKLDPFDLVWVNVNGAIVERLGDYRDGYDFMFETELEWRRYETMLKELSGVEDDQGQGE